MPFAPQIKQLSPGLMACIGVVAAAWVVSTIGGWTSNMLVFCILIGTAVHTLFGLPAAAGPGIRFAAHRVLELAIVLLGASIDVSALAGLGPKLLISVVLLVAVAIPVSFAIGRMLGLPPRLAALVACGNSICGNSAIVAAAPALRAEAKDVASAIAFTAALGIAVVLALPLLGQALGLDAWHYGILAGMSVYAVPQVLAATATAGLVATQIATLVKLVRVMMLGPVVLLLGLTAGRQAKAPISAMIPWFIPAFAAMAVLRNTGMLPPMVMPTISGATEALTLVAMAGLGLSVDLRSVLRSGGRVLMAGTLSILALLAMGFGILQIL
ncbi:YeiH family protein [Falsirhodobacter algicola]|uniref:Putative sulfate exporter family transporter n=1 Tax=Falsirhodobacter algicola TaxID=2692330 RepID=A0A8J8MR19_9RHOB|nr:putative sulfate exporter family transporter [Falsirhodobacter algicola]QUS35162.1 putative sulfate exporter family transporter [Falsirhodobacter algicola]